MRWERYENKNGLGGTFIETNDQWAPRVGVVWDPAGAGRSKVYASYGTYYMPVSAEVNIWFAGATYETNDLVRLRWESGGRRVACDVG